MKVVSTPLTMMIGSLLLFATAGFQVPPAGAQNCSLPSESLESMIVLADLIPEDNVTFNRVLNSRFQTPTTDNINLTGIVATGMGVERLDIFLTDDVAGAPTTTDFYSATLFQLLPLNTEPLTATGSNIRFSLTQETPSGVYMLLTVNPTPASTFPACYKEMLKFGEPETVAPQLLAVSHIDNATGKDIITLTFSEPLSAFALTSLSIGTIANCHYGNTTVSFTPGDQEVTLTITPGRPRQPTACDLATLSAGNTLQLGAAATRDLAGNALSEANDAATYPGTGSEWDVEQPVPPTASEAAAAWERYATALNLILDRWQDKLTDPVWRAMLGAALPQQPGQVSRAAQVRKVILHLLQEDFQDALRDTTSR